MNDCKISKSSKEGTKIPSIDMDTYGIMNEEEEEPAPVWLKEKAKKKEYRDWMVVARRKKTLTPGEKAVP